MSNISIIRIKNDIKKCLQLEKYKIDCEENMFEWKVSFNPNTNIYKNTYLLKIMIPSNYPFSAPSILFETKIFHPNVDYVSGKVCLGILAEWSQKYTMKNILESLEAVLNEPDLDNPVNMEARNLWGTKKFIEKL